MQYLWVLVWLLYYMEQGNKEIIDEMCWKCLAHSDFDQLDILPQETVLATSIGQHTLLAGQKHNTFVSHVIDPDHIWCQLNADDHGDLLEEMAGKIYNKLSLQIYISLNMYYALK